jgi:glycerol-3-phosphate dehydrogenase
VAGGKWTTGRAVAADVVDQVFGAGRSPTTRRPVPGAGDWGAAPSVLLGTARRLHPELGLTREVAEHLSRLYGLRCGAVLDLIAADPALGERVSSRAGCHDVLAQVVVAVRDEWARSLADIVDRRLVLGTLGPVTAGELERVAAVAAPLLGWGHGGCSEAAAEHARRTARRQTWSV